MKFGAMNHPLLPILDEIHLFADFGFDYLELTMDAPKAHYTTVQAQKKDILKALDRRGLGLVGHLPTFVYTADLTESIRQVSLSEMLHSLEAMADLGATKTVLHPSIISGLGTRVMDLSRRLAAESLDIILEKAGKLNIQVCLENLFPRCLFFYEPPDFAAVFRQYPNLKLTLDTGHANVEDKTGRRPLEFIRTFPDRLGHIHINDNKGDKDEHLELGTGTVDFRGVLKALKETGYQETMTFEIFTEDRTCLRKGLEKIKTLLAAA